jgi:hypothetical protein
MECVAPGFGASLKRSQQHYAEHRERQQSATRDTASTPDATPACSRAIDSMTVVVSGETADDAR